MAYPSHLQGSSSPQRILLGLFQASFAEYFLVITLISNAMIYLTVLGSVGKYTGFDSDQSHILPRF